MPQKNKAPQQSRADNTHPPKMLCLTAEAPIEIEAAAQAAEGEPIKLPRFRMIAYTGGPMRLAGWRFPVIVDLAGLAIPSQKRPIRFIHDPGAGVGHTDSIAIEAGRLVAKGVVSRDTSAARSSASASAIATDTNGTSQASSASSARARSRASPSRCGSGCFDAAWSSTIECTC